MKRLVNTGPIGAKKTDSGTARVTAHGFYLSGILYSVSRANIDVIDPVDCCSGTVAHRNSGMTFRWIARRHRFVPHIGIINCIVSSDRYRRIGTLRLGKCIWHPEGGPRRTSISAEHTALQPATLIHWQPRRAVGGHVNVAVESSARA